jgi:hypothetical protein
MLSLLMNNVWLRAQMSWILMCEVILHRVRRCQSRLKLLAWIHVNWSGSPRQWRWRTIPRLLVLREGILVRGVSRKR